MTELIDGLLGYADDIEVDDMAVGRRRGDVDDPCEEWLISVAGDADIVHHREAVVKEVAMKDDPKPSYSMRRPEMAISGLGPGRPSVRGGRRSSVVISFEAMTSSRLATSTLAPFDGQ